MIPGRKIIERHQNIQSLKLKKLELSSNHADSDVMSLSLLFSFSLHCFGRLWTTCLQINCMCLPVKLHCLVLLPNVPYTSPIFCLVSATDTAGCADGCSSAATAAGLLRGPGPGKMMWPIARPVTRLWKSMRAQGQGLQSFRALLYYAAVPVQARL